MYFTYFVHHAFDFVNCRYCSFDPQQVSTSVDSFDTVEYATLVASALTELVQTRRQTLRTNQLAATVEYNVTFSHVSYVDFFNVQVRVVNVTLIAWLFNHCDFFSQASAFRVSTCNDNTVVNAQLQESVTQSAQLSVEVVVRYGYFTVLVTTLLLVSNLVFDLQAASTSFDHLLSHQVSRFSVTETSVNVSNDRYDVSFVVVDLVQDFCFFCRIASFTSCVQSAEQTTQFTCISLTQEGVQFVNQRSYSSFLVHRLVRQRTEVRTQSSYHPTRQVQVTTLSSTKVLLDRDQLLLTYKTVPAAQRLSVLGFVFVELCHVFTHDFGSVTSDIQTSFEFVLLTHTCRRLWADSTPEFVATDNAFKRFDIFLVSRHESILQRVGSKSYSD